MHKITKGLKKKKKGKKSKHKEDELFKPEELEAYRREHQQQASGEESSTQPGQNEEWKKFIALTSGVDDILKKTQGDLNRIKSTSFFQRIPPPSELKKQEDIENKEEKLKLAAKQSEEEEKAEQSNQNLGIVQISESESEEDEDDDIFDTAYIDALEAGEVKLAYIPESPTSQQDGDDPFDTSIAERAILGPAVERKGKKLVPIGAAVEVLTGRVQLPTCAVQRPANRRQILKEKDLLLGSFDDNANTVIKDAATSESTKEIKKTLLDDDSIPLSDEPIDLSKNLQLESGILQVKEIIVESKLKEEDDEDKEFALLAAESVSKNITVVDSLHLNHQNKSVVLDGENKNWAAFDNNINATAQEEIQLDDDPFDTTFAENILPGKAELKQIEKEILNQNFEEKLPNNKRCTILNKVSIKITDPAGERESISSLDRVSESDLNLIKPIHRDLLGGSNTDLSNLSDQPLRPAEQIDENYIEYCDPFDTSIVETAKLPGQTELKFLEKELLGDIQVKNQESLSDDEFDPRASEVTPKERTLSRPDVLNISSSKTVSFDLPSPTHNFLEAASEGKAVKPLTPFYVRKQSVPEEEIEESLNVDPFDTSFVCDIRPGKIELKLIENELIDSETEKTSSTSNTKLQDSQTIELNQKVQSIKAIVDGKNKPIKKKVDLLAFDHADDNAKALSPAIQSENLNEISYCDPFDTSIATNIFPGKTELKLIENELIHSNFNLNVLKNKQDLLVDSTDLVIDKPLSPITNFDNQSFDLEDIDPFDTSIASNIVPGKTELKLLENELI